MKPIRWQVVYRSMAYVFLAHVNGYKIEITRNDYSHWTLWIEGHGEQFFQRHTSEQQAKKAAREWLKSRVEVTEQA